MSMELNCQKESRISPQFRSLINKSVQAHDIKLFTCAITFISLSALFGVASRYDRPYM